jgi:hypothetical protein
MARRRVCASENALPATYPRLLDGVGGTAEPKENGSIAERPAKDLDLLIGGRCDCGCGCGGGSSGTGATTLSDAASAGTNGCRSARGSDTAAAANTSTPPLSAWEMGDRRGDILPTTAAPTVGEHRLPRAWQPESEEPERRRGGGAMESPLATLPPPPLPPLPPPPPSPTGDSDMPLEPPCSRGGGGAVSAASGTELPTPMLSSSAVTSSTSDAYIQEKSRTAGAKSCPGVCWMMDDARNNGVEQRLHLNSYSRPCRLGMATCDTQAPSAQRMAMYVNRQTCLPTAVPRDDLHVSACECSTRGHQAAHVHTPARSPDSGATAESASAG